MANKTGENKVVEIKENPAKAPETPATNGQNGNPAEATEKVSFWKHPIKFVKGKFEEHPVASTAVTVGGVTLLGFAVKAVCDVLGGGNSNDDNEEVDDVLEDEEETDEEEI